MAFISRFHPLLVHFPIALVLAAAGDRREELSDGRDEDQRDGKVNEQGMQPTGECHLRNRVFRRSHLTDRDAG